MGEPALCYDPDQQMTAAVRSEGAALARQHSFNFGRQSFTPVPLLISQSIPLSLGYPGNLIRRVCDSPIIHVCGKIIAASLQWWSWKLTGHGRLLDGRHPLMVSSVILYQTEMCHLSITYKICHPWKRAWQSGLGEKGALIISVDEKMSWEKCAAWLFIGCSGALNTTQGKHQALQYGGAHCCYRL